MQSDQNDSAPFWSYSRFSILGQNEVFTFFAGTDSHIFWNHHTKYPKNAEFCEESECVLTSLIFHRSKEISTIFGWKTAPVKLPVLKIIIAFLDRRHPLWSRSSSNAADKLETIIWRRMETFGLPQSFTNVLLHRSSVIFVDAHTFISQDLMWSRGASTMFLNKEDRFC